MNQHKSVQKLVRLELSPKSQQRDTNSINITDFKSNWEMDIEKTAEASLGDSCPLLLHAVNNVSCLLHSLLHS